MRIVLYCQRLFSVKLDFSVLYGVFNAQRELTILITAGIVIGGTATTNLPKQRQNSFFIPDAVTFILDRIQNTAIESTLTLERIFFPQMSKLWVKFEDYEVTQVSTQGCFILYEFIKAVKKTLPRKLGDYDLDQISFSLTKGGPPLNPNIPLPASNTASEPLYIKVIESSLERDIYNEEHHNHYDQLGKVLASDPIISQIVDTLSNIFSLESYNPKPFILIQDSTGSGKTQCAFALKYAIEQYPQFKFFYLRCSSDCDTLSQVFQECVQICK
jgi:hypothetical protein